MFSTIESPAYLSRSHPRTYKIAEAKKTIVTKIKITSRI
jgi:hypothetical protein